MLPLSNPPFPRASIGICFAAVVTRGAVQARWRPRPSRNLAARLCCLPLCVSFRRRSRVDAGRLLVAQRALPARSLRRGGSLPGIHGSSVNASSAQLRPRLQTFVVPRSGSIGVAVRLHAPVDLLNFACLPCLLLNSSFRYFALMHYLLLRVFCSAGPAAGLPSARSRLGSARRIAVHRGEFVALAVQANVLLRMAHWR